jgi:hypothetical protein
MRLRIGRHGVGDQLDHQVVQQRIGSRRDLAA